MFDEIGCIVAAFLMYFTGNLGILLLVAISLERLYVLWRPMCAGKITRSTVMLTIIVCSSISLFWCVMPLFGWSHYSLEKAKTSCAVEWNERSFSVMSYNVCIFVFVYILPLVFLITANLSIAMTIKRLTRQMVWSSPRSNRFTRERNISYKMMFHIGEYNYQTSINGSKYLSQLFLLLKHFFLCLNSCLYVFMDTLCIRICLICIFLYFILLTITI